MLKSLTYSLKSKRLLHCRAVHAPRKDLGRLHASPLADLEILHKQKAKAKTELQIARVLQTRLEIRKQTLSKDYEIYWLC